MIFPIRYRAAAGILALLVLTVWGAGGDRPARGGVLRAAQRAEPKTFNPVIAMDAPSREVLRRLHADLITIDPVSLDEATAASADYPGHTHHPFPTCFACGTGNPGGLRIYPGAVAPAGSIPASPRRGLRRATSTRPSCGRHWTVSAAGPAT